MKKATQMRKSKKIMKEWKAGELNIGKSPKKVPSGKKGQKQAIAIMLSQIGKARKAMSKRKKK